MLTRQISEADLEVANYERFHHPEPLVQKRMHVLYLKGKKYQQAAIADILDIHRNTVHNCLDLYEATGIEGLRRLGYRGPVSELDAHKPQVEDAFRKHPPRSVGEAARRIKELTGIERSGSRVKAFMHRMKMKPRKTGHIPAKAGPEKQESFLKETLRPLLKAAKKGKCHVFYMDGVHFVLQAFVAMVWCFERVFIPSASGRFRLNVLGAVHATSHEFRAVYNTSYITATTVIALLERLAKDFAGKPIHVVLDNARYQHCKAVLEAAERLRINLVFLPPYSPNLNLIERLWKFVKAEVCHARYYENNELFKNAIISCLNSLHQKPYKTQLKTLLKPNFQLFKNAQNLTN
jgi:transposase